MTTVAGLVDLGRYLSATRPVPSGEADPDDERDRLDLLEDPFCDSGHGPHCEIGRSHQ